MQNGDLIVGIDGVEFENAAHIRKLLASAMVKNQTTLLVHRGNGELEITFDPRTLRNPREAGGWYEYTSR